MKIAHLEERIKDYKASIEAVVSKKTNWGEHTKPLLRKTLNTIVETYSIGWSVQELNWIYNNEAINISFQSFPEDLMDCTNRVPSYRFIPGGALVFSQTYSGDVYVFVMFPDVDGMPVENNLVEFGVMSPLDITEKIIIEHVDEFLKELIRWELPNKRSQMGYSSS